MFRVYLRWPKQRVSEKTTTQNEAIALQAFDALIRRGDLAGKPVVAMMTHDNRPVKAHPFTKQPRARAC